MDSYVILIVIITPLSHLMAVIALTFLLKDFHNCTITYFICNVLFHVYVKEKLGKKKWLPQSSLFESNRERTKSLEMKCQNLNMKLTALCWVYFQVCFRPCWIWPLTQRSVVTPHVESQNQRFTVNWWNMFQDEESRTLTVPNVMPILSCQKVPWKTAPHN